MRIRIGIITFGIYSLLVLSSCNGREFPPQQTIEIDSQTEVYAEPSAPLLEHKNSIYCSTFLYAFNELREITKKRIVTSIHNIELQKIINSNFFKNSISSEELHRECLITSNSIKISVAFEKKLDFKKKFRRNELDLEFKNQSVESFGCYGGVNKISSQVQVLFHENKDEFAVRLKTKNEDEELILYSPKKHDYPDLKELYQTFTAKRTKHSEKAKSSFASYQFKSNDLFIAPVISFNYLKNFKQIIGDSLVLNSTPYVIDQANQSIAFILDEAGAKVRSKSSFSAKATSAAPDDSEPKHYKFDDSFLIILKQKSSKNPYLMVWVDNSDLLLLK